MIADRHEQCSVVFADLVGFTAHSKGKDPAQIVGELNTIFSRFDAIAAKHRAEKIKTIGDGYLAACGLPDADPDHVAQACDLALAMVEAMPVLDSDWARTLTTGRGERWKRSCRHRGLVKVLVRRLGRHGQPGFRLESNGTPGVVVTSAAVVSALQGRYTFQPLGAKDLKGEGMTELFAVVGAHRVV